MAADCGVTGDDGPDEAAEGAITVLGEVLVVYVSVTFEALTGRLGVEEVAEKVGDVGVRPVFGVPY